MQVLDLQDRLAFIYSWACEGPPVVMPVGMLAKPKAYLTAVQQVRVLQAMVVYSTATSMVMYSTATHRH